MKKNFPLAVLEALEPFLNKKGPSFEIIEKDNCLLSFKDNDPNSDFYFDIIQFKKDSRLQFCVERKPGNKTSIANRTDWVSPHEIDAYLNAWIEILNGYEKVKTKYDDPIIESFSNEYFTEFDIIDEDAETAPFNTKQILLLDERLENIELGIDKFQNENNKVEIQNIKSSINELRENLTTKSKRWVIKKMSNLFAQITKQGPSLLKEFLSEAKKMGFKEAIQFIAEKGMDMIS